MCYRCRHYAPRVNPRHSSRWSKAAHQPFPPRRIRCLSPVPNRLAVAWRRCPASTSEMDFPTCEAAFPPTCAYWTALLPSAAAMFAVLPPIASPRLRPQCMTFTMHLHHESVDFRCFGSDGKQTPPVIAVRLPAYPTPYPRAPWSLRDWFREDGQALGQPSRGQRP
jgi:hypothetical protein